MPLPIPPHEPRSLETLHRHYQIEKELADRLRDAPRVQRRRLYGEVYDEYFRRVDLPGLDAASRADVVRLEAMAVEPFLDENSVFLEIGAGDCAVSLYIASKVRRAFALDASAQTAAQERSEEGFGLVIAETLPLADASVDVAYSCHFLEHLHPEDADEHLAEVRRVLRPGGCYVCVTPSRLWGPHDTSRYFDEVPTGFHLREYTHAELARRMYRAGFGRVDALRGIGEPARRSSLLPYSLVENTLDLLPVGVRRRVMDRFLLSGRPPFRPLEQVKVIGTV